MLRAGKKVLLLGLLAGLMIFGFGSPQWVTAGETIAVPKLEDFVPALDSRGKEIIIDVSQVEQVFRKSSPVLKKFYSNRSITKIIIPDTDWLKHLIATSQNFFWDLGIRWKAETWDCDNFSILLSSSVALKLWKAGYTDVRCGFGWMIVDAKHKWAGVPPQRHALVFIVTSKGPAVLEPQTGDVVPLAKYPNRKYIERVFLL